MYLRELGLYKHTVFTKIRNSDDIKEILLGKNYNVEIVDDLLDEHIFPYLYVPDVQSEAKTYICVDVIVPKVPNPSIKNLKIIIWVFAHKSLMRYSKKGYIGTRTDILSDVLDRLLDTSREFGIGRLKLEDVGIFNSEKLYYGRVLTYSASDFNVDKRL